METPSSYDQANLRSIFFADYDGTETGYPSTWRAGIQLCERDAQTDEVMMGESGTQASSQSVSATQTDEMAPSMAAAMAQMEKGAEISDPALGAFLSRACPGVEQQLDRNLRETALNGYDVNWGGDDAALACIHELRFPGAKQAFIDEGGVSALSPEKEEVPSLPVSSISWNSNGWTVAVGFGGCQQGLGWSDQPACIAVWNLARPLVNKEKPDHVLTSPSCV